MNQTIKFRLRRTIILTLRWVCYVVLLVSILQAFTWTSEWFHQFLAVSLLLIFSSYLAIDLQYVSSKRIWLAGLVCLWGSIFLALQKISDSSLNDIWTLSTRSVVAVMVLLHLWLLLLILQKINLVTNRRKVDWLAFLTPWVALFAFCMAWMFALLTSMKINTQKIDCNEFYKAVGDVVRFLWSPVLLWVDATSRIQPRVDKISDQSIWELLWISSDEEDVIEDSLFLSQGSGGTLTRSQLLLLVESLSGGNEDEIIDLIQQNMAWSIATSSSSETSGIMNLLQEYRQRFIYEIVNDKELINQWVCSLVVSEAEKKLQKPGFRFSIAILLFFIFSPILNFLFLIVIGWWLLLFLVLKYFGVRHKEKILQEMEVLR